VRVIINQNGNAYFTLGSNQFANITKIEMEDKTALYSVGIEQISFALYKKEKRAITALNSLMGFIVDETRETFRFEQDKGN
jgi:hypothetical protein